MSLYQRDENKFSRRLLLLGASQLALFTVIAGRLQYLQVARSEEYETLAEANRVNVSQISAQRGRILDRNGLQLAGNDRNLQLQMIPEQVEDMDATIDNLARIIGLSAAEKRDMRRKIRRGPRFKPVIIAEDLSWEAFSEININLPYFSGIEPLVGQKRVYSSAEAASHLIGFVGDKTRADLQRVGEIIGDKVGRTGVERDFEMDLRGLPGIRHLEVNAYGRTVRELRSKPGETGKDVELSIDLSLQDFASKRLAGHSGSALVMDIETGEMLAMSSTPSFDLNKFSRGIERTSWEALLDHERKPLVNKPLRGLYAPGSTFKMLVALAALEEGLVKPQDKVECTGQFKFSGEEFHCWTSLGHGPTDMVKAIEQSCDTYFYDLSLKVGINRIEAMAKRFGFGKPTGINFEGEKTGTVPGRDWKRANFDTGWRTGETIITAIGQGYLLSTPLQLSVMTAALANGGKLVTPRITKVTDDVDAPREIGLNPENLDIVKRGMYRAVNRPDGTGYASSLLINGARMSGKTGTVQVRRISKDERLTGVVPNHKLDWHLRDHSLFVGYAPHDKPKYAVTVVIEHGGGGAQVAAPMARDIMVHLLNNGKPMPKPPVETPEVRNEEMLEQEDAGLQAPLDDAGQVL